MRPTPRFLLALLAATALCRAAAAEVVVLTSGTIIEGEVVVDEANDTVQVTVRGATMTFPRAQVARIGNETRRPAGNVTVSTAPGREPPTLSRDEREQIIRRNLAVQMTARTILGELKAGTDDATRAAALKRLESLLPFPTVIVAEFLDAKNPAPARFVAAVAIGRAGDGSASTSLANAAVADPEALVRREAAVSIGRIRDLRCLSSLVDAAAKANSPLSVTRAAEAIRNAGRKEAINGLIVKAMRERKRTAVRGTTIGMSGMGAGREFGTPTLNVNDYSAKKLPQGCVLVLRELTGQDFGADLNAWARWWKANHQTFKL